TQSAAHEAAQLTTADNALIAAVENQDKRAAQVAMAAGANLSHILPANCLPREEAPRDSKYNELLHKAAYYGNLLGVKIALLLGADIDSRSFLNSHTAIANAQINNKP